MRGRILTCCVALLVQLSVARNCVSQDQTGTLQWNNGDSLGGRLLGYEDDHVRWRSGQFADPLEIHGDFISAMEFQAENRQESSVGEPFRVETSAGDVVFGALVGLDANAVELNSGRLGTIVLRRESVREIRQLRHTQILYDGPRWLDGWTVLKAGRSISEWKATEHGHLYTEKYGGELYHELPELTVAEINLVLRWTGKPGFQLDFSAPQELISTRPKPRLSIKSWGDDVVAQSSVAATDFQPLEKLAERQQELRLRLVWDNQSGEVVISGEGGRELGKVLVSTEKSSGGFGILIKNRSDDLTIEQVRLSKWNGATKSEDRERGKSYLRLASGELIGSSVVKLNPETREILLSDGQTIPLGEVAVAEFMPTSKKALQPHHIRFFDGTEFTGKLESIGDTAIRMAVPAAREPVVATRTGLSSIRCFQGRTNEFDFHLIGDGGNKLSGNLRPVLGSGVLGWSPIGARHPVAIKVGLDQTIERRIGQAAGPVDHSGGEVVYLRDDSVLIGDVHRIDRHSILFSTPYTEQVELPIPHVRATELLNASGRVSFTDPDWEFMRAERPLQRAQEVIEVSEPISMRDLSLVHGGRLTFSVAWDPDFVGLLTLHLGTSTKQPRNSIARFTFSQDRLSARCLINAAVSRTLPPFPERRASISLEAKDRKLSVWVNGILAFKAETKSPIEETGIWLQCGSARGNVQSINLKRKPRLIVERLRVGEGANQLGSGFAAASGLEMILTLPRNRLNSVPESVVCSSNGDLLRGKLESMSADELVFNAGYEQVIMPRADVSAIVWLRRADSEGEPQFHASENSLRLKLRDGSVFVLSDPQIVDQFVVGEHAALKTCRIPLRQVLKIQNGKLDIQSLARMTDWKLEPTPEPKFVDADAGDGLDSPLIGKSVGEIEIPLLDDQKLRLGDHADKILVLDFWASWCAPCIRSLPKLAALVDSFPQDQVRLIAVNVEELPFTIHQFLATRDFELVVGVDVDAGIGKQFGVSDLPQTVIVGPGSKIERVFIGAPTDLHTNIQQAIRDLLPSTD